ncbi:MAG: phosphomannose isomerase type II C-terminal cupin domain [Sneathiella sp.]|nr:phosphomannose isomerase type II C-terminal cupin domain [Sneathiella sp.]
MTDVGKNYVTKTIVVSPGKRHSLQYHQHRTEFWLVIEGTGTAVIDGISYSLESGNSIVIPKRAKHRLCCTGDFPLIIVEVQTGRILKETDIVRLDDDFGRL